MPWLNGQNKFVFILYAHTQTHTQYTYTQEGGGRRRVAGGAQMGLSLPPDIVNGEDEDRSGSFHGSSPVASSFDSISEPRGLLAAASVWIVLRVTSPHRLQSPYPHLRD